MDAGEWISCRFSGQGGKAVGMKTISLAGLPVGPGVHRSFPGELVGCALIDTSPPPLRVWSSSIIPAGERIGCSIAHSEVGAWGESNVTRCAAKTPPPREVEWLDE
ncbi:hypothetical protein SUGI_0248810 [Cryptomeria japonica]|nr:hypothetical protein SUGI_0248810 [Cryptomeria japonica]